jgi:2-polyprenyl-3-methyl-5-hydroxy-6-metoxy-1,4-benzoquinol methylase
MVEQTLAICREFGAVPRERSMPVDGCVAPVFHPSSPTNTMPLSCILCGDTNSTSCFTECNHTLRRCSSCGHTYSSYTTNQHYDGYFGEEIDPAGMFWWDGAHRAMYTAFRRKFLDNRGGNLLDIGCGLGYFVKFVADTPGWNAVGCELSAAAVRFSNAQLRLPNVFAGSVEALDFPESHFDVITLWDVIEHLTDPRPVLRAALRLLKPGGVLFLHTPNIDLQLRKASLLQRVFLDRSRHYLELQDHMNLYSPRTLSDLLADCGYRGASFVHLPPIQSAAGSRSGALKLLKNVGFLSVSLLARVTRERMNFDNLFAVTCKPETADVP